VPPALRERLVTQSSGNPFHLEELIRMLIDDGVISTRGPWRIDMGRLDSERVPDTLVGVLQSRLDHLDAAEFRVLQVASVFGRCFWDSALAAVLHEMAGPDAPPIDVPAVLQSLLGAELIYRVAGSRFGGAAEAEFRHDVLRAVAYDTLPLDERPRLHRCAANWLMPAAGDRSDEHALAIADHLDKAAQRPEAAGWYLRAARRAAGAGRPRSPHRRPAGADLRHGHRRPPRRCQAPVAAHPGARQPRQHGPAVARTQRDGAHPRAA